MTLSEDTTSALAIIMSSGIMITLICLLILYISHIWHAGATVSPSATPITLIEHTHNDGEHCYTCMDKRANTILLNCGHTGLCVGCARTIMQANQNCPLCRQGLSGMIHMILEDESV